MVGLRSQSQRSGSGREGGGAACQLGPKQLVRGVQLCRERGRRREVRSPAIKVAVKVLTRRAGRDVEIAGESHASKTKAV